LTSAPSDAPFLRIDFRGDVLRIDESHADFTDPGARRSRRGATSPSRPSTPGRRESPNAIEQPSPATSTQYVDATACPDASATRGQMAVFLAKTFGLLLDGP